MVFKQKQAEKPFYRRHGYLLSIQMKRIVDSGYMDREPARFRDKGGEGK